MKLDGYIVAETNHQIYAYCNSTLSVKVLSLIMDMKFRMPNLVVGKITRSSLRRAFTNGITAEEIITFLHQNAHAETRKLEYPIPETFIHQIELWEKEENAVKHDEGVLYDRFPSHEEYVATKKHAIDLGILLWASDSTKMLFVKAGGQVLLENRKRLFQYIAEFENAFMQQKWSLVIGKFNDAASLSDIIYTDLMILQKLARAQIMVS